MQTNIFNKPSFYAQILSGFIIMYCVYLYWVGNPGSKDNLVMLSLLGISISIHSVWHLLMETNYDFNPIATIFGK